MTESARPQPTSTSSLAGVGGVLAGLPAQFDRRALARMEAFTGQLDTIVVLERGAPKISRAALESLFRDRTYFPAWFGDQAMASIPAGASDVFTDTAGLTAVPVAEWPQWLTGVVPLDASELSQLGMPAHPSLAQLKTFVGQQGVYSSGLAWTGADMRKALEGLFARGLTLHEVGSELMLQTANASLTLSDWWSCIVRHVGWFIAITVFAALGAAIITAFFTMGATLAMWIWLAGVLGGGYATVALNCLVNPYR